MSWEQLLAIYQDASTELDRERNLQPLACPNDGEPLRFGPQGELWCPFDGWRWDGTTGITGVAPGSTA